MFKNDYILNSYKITYIVLVFLPLGPQGLRYLLSGPLRESLLTPAYKSIGANDLQRRFLEQQQQQLVRNTNSWALPQIY